MFGLMFTCIHDHFPWDCPLSAYYLLHRLCVSYYFFHAEMRLIIMNISLKKQLAKTADWLLLMTVK